MSSIYLKRTLGVAGVTGGLLLVGAGVALADDAGTTDAFGLTQGSGEAGVEAPISLGGLSIGLSSTSSQQSGGTTTTTTDEGTSTSTHEDASSTTSDLGIDVGAITVDPMAALAGSGSAQGATGSDEGAGATSGAGTAGVAAPVSVGGVSVTGSTTTQDASAQESTVTDADGASATQGSTSTSESTTTGTLGLGETTLDPAAVLDGTAWAAGAGDEDDVTGTSGATGSADLSSPVNLGGLTAGFTDERSGTDEAWTMRTDSDGDATWSRTERAHESATTAGVSTGEITADPAAWLSGSTEQAVSGDDRDGSLLGGTEGDLGVAAPVTFGGADAWVADERSTWSSATHGTRTDDVARETTTERADTTRTAGTAGIGEVALLPALTGTTESATGVEGRDEDGTFLGEGAGALDLTAPLWAEGAGLAGSAERESAAADSAAVTTDEGTTRTTTWSETADAVHPSLATGPVQGDLAGWAWGELTGAGSVRD